MIENSINPSGNMHNAFINIIKSITIKYSYKAQKFDNMNIKMKADAYMDAKNKRDTFFSYRDYTDSEFDKAEFYESRIIKEARNGNWNAIPVFYRDTLLEIRRQREITMFEEQNNYYRMLNGFPDIEDTKYFYVSSSLAIEYDIDINIPLHKIQDYYNSIEDGQGDYLISVVEGSGYVDRLIELHPDKKYLNYLGSNRIDIYTARSAKNFQIIQIKNSDVMQSILDEFVKTYEQCREYFVKTIYMSDYSKFIDHYDNFIGLCIMVMTMQQISVKQISLGIKRNYFDIFAIKALYEMYDIPYNLNIDEATQSYLVQNLNLLIQDKATDKVLYSISNLLGFSNINIYKYYLTKDHKMDDYDVPIFKYTQRFNSDTGEMETVPDYEAMYDLYFQKYELKNKDFSKSFKDKANRVEYNEVVPNDPFWWEDQHIYERLWESEYNFVESKYLSLGISYSMTEIIFENVIFLKMILQEEKNFKGIQLKLPRILDNNDVSLIDVIICMLCLVSTKHKLWGEIISIPTQVIAVNDYIHNTERGGAHSDTFKFNYKYFFDPDDNEDKEKMDSMKEDLINHMNDKNKNPLLASNLSFNFDYYSLKNPDREKHIEEMKKILGEDDYNKFLYYVEKVSIVKSGNNSEKIKALNEMYASVKGLYKLLSYYTTTAVDKETYYALKNTYNSLFLSKEISDLFSITTDVENEETGEHETFTRTAWTYFEYLYHKNPTLYFALYEFDIKEEYKKYLLSNDLNENTFSLYEFRKKVAKGDIFLDYGQFIDGDSVTRDERLYTYVNHIISRLEMIIDDIKFMYLITDTSTPLEKLLLQLVRFFKSYTVDIISLDTLFINDFKMENMFKLIDDIHYMEKTIRKDTGLKISYSDNIHNISNTFELDENNSLKDKIQYNSNLIINEKSKETDKIHRIWFSD